MLHVRERPLLHVTITVERPDDTGPAARWARDEPHAENVPSGLTWSSTMPGGFESFDCALPRDSRWPWPDLAELSTVTIRDAGWDIVGEYRLERTPSETGDRRSISPSGVGWQAHLDDNQAVIFLGVDQSWARWQDMTPARHAELTDPEGLKLTIGDVQIGAPVDSGTAGYQSSGPALFPLDGATALHMAAPPVGAVSELRAISEAHYDSGPTARIARVLYDYVTNVYLEQHDANEAVLIYPPTPWEWKLLAGDDADYYPAGTYESVDIDASSIHGNGQFVPTTPRRFITAQFMHNYPGAPAVGYGERLMFRQLAVVGDHGLAVHPWTESGWDAESAYLLSGIGGIHDADLLRYAIARWAPLLNFASDSFQGDPYTVGQAAWLDPTQLSTIVRDINRFSLNDWAVWENRTFYWHPRDARGRSWRARVAEADLQSTGPQVDRVWESIVVSYQDADGSTRTVGPPGSGADIEAPQLHDPDPQNPANRRGIIRRDLLALGIMSTPARSIEVGWRFLQEAKRLDSSGSARIVGHIEDDRGVLHPYHHVRAGDTITFTDSADPSPRRIVRATNDADAHACSIDIDAPPEGLAALLERLGAVLLPLGA